MVAGRAKVLVAMSGGVDSSVAAALLRRAGHEVVGCFMRLGSPGEALDEPSQDHARPLRIAHQGCCSITDAGDARLVAAELGIPLYVCNFKQEFSRVIDYFASEYAGGRTPNPCVRCNDWLKFGKLHDYATKLGCDFVASGHYARIVRDGSGIARLAPGVDARKDQSYVLFGIPRRQLESTLLPIGEMDKPRTRELARQFGLPVHDKPDSQEICFVPDNDYASLVARRRPEVRVRGELVDRDGRVLGTHEGQHHFTIGQRRGVALALGRPVYVVARDADTNRVVLGWREDLRIARCVASEANWLADPPAPGQAAPCLAKFRSNAPAVPARFHTLGDDPRATPSGRRGRFGVAFDSPQEAVAPGQAIVLYERGVSGMGGVIGGGWIVESNSKEA